MNIDRTSDGTNIFISYKSEDVSFVRPFAEQLLAEGYRPWFNEYDIKHHQIDDFQWHVNLGIDRADWAVLFSNAKYADSAYCHVEVERILRRLSLERICIFGTDGTGALEHLYPEFAGCVINLDLSELEASLRTAHVTLSKRGVTAKIPEPLYQKPTSAPHYWMLKEIAAEFDPCVWRPEDTTMMWSPAYRESLDITGQRRNDYHTFVGTPVSRPIRMWVEYERLEEQFQESISARVTETSSGDLRILESEVDDRIRLKDELKSFAGEADRIGKLIHRTEAMQSVNHSLSKGFEEIGVHMFSTSDGVSQYKHRLFSLRLTAKERIFRVYKLGLVQPQLKCPVAIRFVFQFEDDKQDFFRSLPSCDFIVNSLRWMTLQSDVNLTTESINRKFGQTSK